MVVRVTGILSRELFRKDDFSIIAIKPMDIDNLLFEQVLTMKTFVVKGRIPKLDPDEQYIFVGNIEENNQYGLQMQTTSVYLDTDAHKSKTRKSGNKQIPESIVKYLSGNDFMGIGNKTATTIVYELGNKAIDIIANDMSVINSLSISDKQK